MDRESDFMKVWVMKDYNRKQWNKRHSISIGILTRKKPHVSPLAFYNVDAVLMGEYFPDVIFFNFKTKNIDVLQLEKGLLHECFPFRSTFIAKEGAQL